MKKFAALLLSLLLLLPLFTACGSPYDRPEKYVSLPPLSEISVKNSEVESTLKGVVDELLEDLTGEHFVPVTGSDETVRLGDKVYITYTGTPKDPSVTFSSTAQEALNATEADYAFLIPGTDMLPKAVETAIVGTKAGDTISVSVTYTEDDTDIQELIGKEVTLNITVLRFSRLSVSAKHALKLQFTASLADKSEPTAALAPYLTGSVETVELFDKEDTFNELFRSEELLPHVLGRHKLETFSFTMTLDAGRAAELGYENGVDIVFEATVREASETPTALTDTIVQDLSYGEYQTVDEYMVFCREICKEDLALKAVAAAATFVDDLPQKEYDSFYEENYNEALYEYLGYGYDYTTEEMAGLLTEEVLAKVEDTAHSNTVSELRERFLLEYLYDLLSLSLTEEEYGNALDELYRTYQIEFSYMLYYYGITNASDLEAFLGRDYLEVQFLYEKLLPLLKTQVQYVD